MPLDNPYQHMDNNPYNNNSQEYAKNPPLEQQSLNNNQGFIPSGQNFQ